MQRGVPLVHSKRQLKLYIRSKVWPISTDVRNSTTLISSISVHMLFTVSHWRQKIQFIVNTCDLIDNSILLIWPFRWKTISSVDHRMAYLYVDDRSFQFRSIPTSIHKHDSWRESEFSHSESEYDWREVQRMVQLE